jgi:hypothetical protein
MFFDSQSSNLHVSDSAHIEPIVRRQFHFILSYMKSMFRFDDGKHEKSSHVHHKLLPATLHETKACVCLGEV